MRWGGSASSGLGHHLPEGLFQFHAYGIDAKQPRPFTGDDTVVGRGYGSGVSADFTNKTLDPVARHGISHLAAHRDAEAETTIRSMAINKEKVRLMHFTPFMGQEKKLGPFPESQRGRKAETGRHQLLGGNLYRQTLAPFGAATLDDKTPVCRSHPNKKTVGPFSADITGLKGSFHGYVVSPEECVPLCIGKAVLLTIFSKKCQDQIYDSG